MLGSRNTDITTDGTVAGEPDRVTFAGVAQQWFVLETIAIFVHALNWI
jgi:hypothetical protein